MVRLRDDDPSLIKQYMDAGARSLMFPNMRDATQAREIVRATRYPPHGIRGYSGSPRANRFGRVAGYHQKAHEDVLIAVQIECANGVANAADIASVDGVDALFIGPGDLSANLGHFGNPATDEVQAAIRAVFDAARAGGKVGGILAAAKDDAQRYADWGCRLLAVGTDVTLLAKAADALVASLKSA